MIKKEGNNIVVDPFIIEKLKSTNFEIKKYIFL